MIARMTKNLGRPLLGACAAAVVFTTATALAGSGVGGVLNLGQTNTVNGSSVLTGATAAPQLKVVNQNTANHSILAQTGEGSGIALYGKHTGSTGTGAGVQGETASPDGAGVLARNTGGGPALALLVSAGKAPFTVNSAVQVPNLNADRLDGLDAPTFYSRPTVPPGNVITTLASAGMTGWFTAATIGADGLPLISFYDVMNFRLAVAHCSNVTCSSASSVPLVG